MNRYLATPLILLLGAAALPATAQDRGRSGAREESHNRSVERESRNVTREDRGSRQQDGGKRDQPAAYSNNGGTARGADYGQGARQNNGRQNIATSGFGVPNAGARDYGNSGRGNGGYDGRGGGNGGYGNGGRVSRDNVAHDSSHRGDYGAHGNSGSNSRHDGRSNNRYDNRYGYTDYRRSLPRTDRRSYNNNRYDNNYRHDNRYGGGYGHNSGRHYNSWRDNGWRVTWNHGWTGHRYRASSRYYYPRGYSYNRWDIGIRLPLAFLSANYYVNYDTYGLTVPPYGCRWLRVDGDLLLVEVGSGEIVDILYGFYY